MRKRILSLACLFALGTAAFAQSKGDMAIGGNLNYGSETSFGIGAKFQYNITNRLRLEPEFNYYFQKDHVSYWDTGASIHYLFPVASDVTLYPLVGLGYGQGKWHGGEGWSYTNGYFQAKIGGGAEFKLSNSWKLNIEPKYQFMDSDDDGQFVINVGISYCF